MKKIKQILSILGVILLLGLYLSTLLCALFAQENVMQLVTASLYATVVIPTLLWLYSFLYRRFRKKDDDDPSA